MCFQGSWMRVQREQERNGLSGDWGLGYTVSWDSQSVITHALGMGKCHARWSTSAEPGARAACGQERGAGSPRKGWGEGGEGNSATTRSPCTSFLPTWPTCPMASLLDTAGRSSSRQVAKCPLRLSLCVASLPYQLPAHPGPAVLLHLGSGCGLLTWHPCTL